jgi:hypothetical protein
MITCKKCNAQLAEGSKFCYNCGAEVTEIKYCAKCGTPIGNESSYCMTCGAPVAAVQTPISVQEKAPEVQIPSRQVFAPIPVPNPMQQSSQAGAPVKKSGSKLPFILIGAGALVLAILLAAFMVPKVFSIITKTPEGIVYMKDDEINYSSLSKVKPKEITDNLYAGTTSENDYAFTSYVCFSENGKRMFYPDEMSDMSEGATIYYCNISAKKQEGQKIDSDITSYVINKKGTKVYYLKGTDGDFYQSDLKDKDKIDSDVVEFYVDETGNNLVYITNDGTIYRKEGTKDSEKIDNNATLRSVSSDLKSIIYISDGALYIKSGKDDKEKIDSDVYDIIKTYDTGEVYYLKSNDASLSLSEFVNDDLADSDSAMEEPIEPAYPDYYSYQPTDTYPTEPDYMDYADYWGDVDWDTYYAAYDQYAADISAYTQKWDDAYYAAIDQYNLDYDKYTSDYDEYYAKIDRDSLRETFATEKVTLTTYSLYYYGEGESKLITDAYNTYNDYSFEAPVLVYQNNIKGEYSRMNMSEITSYEDVYNLASATTSFTTDVYIAVNSKAVKLDQKDGASYYMNNDGTRLYFLNNVDVDESTGDLSYFVIKGDTVSSPEIYDTDVYSYNLVGDEGVPAYFKNVEDGSGDLYLDKKKIESDAYAYSAYSIPGTDTITYYTDYNDTDYTYTLKTYDGKKSNKIADDIYNFTILKNNNIAFISDYDDGDQTGDLYVYNGGKENKLIDKEVSQILYVSQNYFWGGSYSDY